MTEVFESYEQEFCKYTNISAKKLESFQSYSSDKKEQIINEVQYELSQADYSLKSMKTEISTQPQSIRQQANQKIRKYQQELDQLRKKLMRQEDEYTDQKNKENLMGARIELSDMNQKEKNNFLQPGQILSDGSTKLKGALNQGHEALDMADNIQLELNRQNEVLDRNIDRNQDIRSDLHEANGLITTMKNNILKNKLLLWGILVFLVTVGFIIIYFKWIKSDSTDQVNNNNTDDAPKVHKPDEVHVPNSHPDTGNENENEQKQQNDDDPQQKDINDQNNVNQGNDSNNNNNLFLKLDNQKFQNKFFQRSIQNYKINVLGIYDDVE